jgi:hypothetical protein
MMKRREFITLLGGVAAWPLAAGAQQTAMPVIGFLQRSKPVRTDFADFRDGLKALGYEDGRNIRIEQRYADLNIDLLRALAQELVAMNVKVIVIDGFATIQTVMAAIKTVPIVSALIAGPDQFGIANLARPGATSLAYRSRPMILVASGWNCSRSSYPTRAVSLFCVTNTTSTRFSYMSSRMWRERLMWSSACSRQLRPTHGLTFSI